MFAAIEVLIVTIFLIRGVNRDIEISRFYHKPEFAEPVNMSEKMIRPKFLFDAAYRLQLAVSTGAGNNRPHGSLLPQYRPFDAN